MCLSVGKLGNVTIAENAAGAWKLGEGPVVWEALLEKKILLLFFLGFILFYFSFVWKRSPLQLYCDS